METVRSTNGEGKHARLAGHNHDDGSDDDVYSMTNTHTELQGDQLYMAVCFLVKSCLSSVRMYCSVHWTSHTFTRCQNHNPTIEKVVDAIYMN